VFELGDVVRFESAVAGKRKFHLCVSLQNQFIFLNSPKAKSFVGDFAIDSSDGSGLTPTPAGKSIAACNLVLTYSAAELVALKAKKVGEVSRKALRELFEFIESSTTIDQETKDALLDGLGDWYPF
jgi:hypothetical protein